jgi:hypothetical protein
MRTEKSIIESLRKKQPTDAKDLKRLWAKHCPDIKLVQLEAGRPVWESISEYGVNQDGRYNAICYRDCGGPETENLETVIKAIIKQRPAKAVSAFYYNDPLRIPTGRSKFFFIFGVCWIGLHPDYDKDAHYTQAEWQVILNNSKPRLFDRLFDRIFDFIGL